MNPVPASPCMYLSVLRYGFIRNEAFKKATEKPSPWNWRNDPTVKSTSCS